MKRLALLLGIFGLMLASATAPAFAQLNKPTPTALPPATAYFEIPDSYSLWASTDYAVQSWNIAPVTMIIQAIILLVLVAAGLFLLTRFIRELTRKDAED